MPTHPDWAELNRLTAEYDFEQCAAGQDQAVFCRLHQKLSEVKSKVSAARGGPSKLVPFLYIFADTLVVDEPFLPSPSTTIVARVLTVEGDTPLVAPDAVAGIGGISAIQLLTQRVEGGPLQLMTKGKQPSTVQVDGSAPESIRFVSNQPATQSKGALELLDLLRYPIAWNSLKAGFAAAAILSEKSTEEKNLSLAMLRWTHRCCTLIAGEDGPFQSEAADLSYQSSSLMVLMGTENAPPFVPVLSQDFYEKRIAGLLTVVQSYEQKIDQLETRTDIKQAVQEIALATKDVAHNEIAPIEVAIANTKRELDALQQQYDELKWQFVLQGREVDVKRVDFQNALEVKLFWDKVKIAFDLIQAIVGMAVAVGSIVAAPEATAGLAGEAITAAGGAINLLQKAIAAGADLSDAMRGVFAKLKEAGEKLKALQKALEDVVKSGKTLYEAAQKGLSTLPKKVELPELDAPNWAEISTMDPAMEWNLFENAVEASMKKYVEDKIDGASKYLLSLKALVEYGKAINGKIIAIARLQARFMELHAQKKAAEMAEQRWLKLEAESKNDLEKKAALTALLLQRTLNAKRALLTAAKAFRAAFEYRWLKEPEFRISLDMKYTALNEQFVNIKRDIEKLLTSAPPDQRFDTDFITLPVRRPGKQEVQDGFGYAVLTPKSKEGPAETTISWSIPIEMPYFRGVPDDGNIALFIEEGWFYLDGAKPNKQNFVKLKIGTSGQFANGYGRFGADRRFVSAPPETQAMDFVYKQDASGHQSDPSAGGAGTPWKPATVVAAAYMTPSPFTQWTAQIFDASALDDVIAVHVRLKGYYHRAEKAAERPGWDADEQRTLDGAGCLKKLAVLATGVRPDVSLRHPDQEDKAFMWKAPSVHPLQVLENTYQRIVRAAGAHPGADPVKAESETLSRFFIQDAGQAELFKHASLNESDGKQLAAVKMNHLIASFYLYRLLVQYRAEADKEISDDLRADLSGDLTKLLHNGDRTKMSWLSDWLTKKIADLGSKVEALNKNGNKRFVFFLKGGRALNYFLGTPEKGENDWDTQVVINPTLPAEEWYQCFTEVHDVLLVALKAFKAEFTELVEKNSAPFAEYLRDKAGPEADDDEEQDENEASDVHSGAEHASCKAELIDIGIPRRDSPSALEEWMHLSAANALMKSDGVIYPHREYYLNEYLMMVRDAFLPDAEVRKAPKRIARLGLILKSDRGRNGIAPLPFLPGTAAAIAGLSDKGRQELFGVILSQFAEAYNLAQDPELAARFDLQCAALIKTPPPLPPGLADLLDDAQKITAMDVGVAHELSTLMDKHWKSRNDFFEQNEDFFTGFVRDLSNATGNALKRVNAQFALAGSYAARLQAKHLRLAPSGLEPIRRVLIKLQCERGADRPAVMSAVRDMIGKVADATGKVTITDASDGDKRSLLLYWKQKVTIGDFAYSPLVMKIRVAEQTGNQLPVLASIDGIPVLDLRYLVADYLKKTSKIDERGSRRVLSSATTAISEMLSRFDFESDDVG